MRVVRDGLVARYGEGYGRIRLVWLCQKYDITPLDEVPEAMYNDIKS